MNTDAIVLSIRSIIDEFAFKVDEDGNNISIFNKTKEELKTFLNENTSITDDEKARIYADFLMQSVSGIVNEIIHVSSEAPLQEAQIDSIKVNDKVKQAETASDVALAKAEIDTLYPTIVALKHSEKNLFEAEAELNYAKVSAYSSEVGLEKTKQEIIDKKAELEECKKQYNEKLAITLENNKKVVEAEQKIETNTIELNNKIKETYEANGKLKEAEYEKLIAESEYTKSSTDIQRKKIDEETAEIKKEEAVIEYETKNLELEAEESSYYAELAKRINKESEIIKKDGEVERAKAEKANSELEYLTVKNNTTGADGMIEDAKAKAFIESQQINKEIALAKAETKIKIANLYANAM